MVNPNALKVVPESPRRVFPLMEPGVCAQKFQVVEKPQSELRIAYFNNRPLRGTISSFPGSTSTFKGSLICHVIRETSMADIRLT